MNMSKLGAYIAKEKAALQAKWAMPLYHVEYDSGMINGRFFADGTYRSWAQDKANQTGRPVKVCRVDVGMGIEVMARVLNGEYTDTDLTFGEQEIIEPEGAGEKQ
jgi:hypothetical protein